MRRYATLALLIVALAVGAGWLVARLAPSPPPPRGAVLEPDSPAPGPAGPVLQEVDLAELARLDALRRAREQYAALREAFTEGRPTAAGAARLEPALAGLWPAPSRPDVACRGQVCRVLPRPTPAGWQAALEDSDAVHALAERVAVDPDASTTPAYLLLAPVRSEEPAPREAMALPPPAPAAVREEPTPAPGPAAPREEPAPPPGPPPQDDRTPPRADEYLHAVEAAVRASPEVAACLAEAEPGAALVLHLAVVDGALASRLDDGLDPQAARCAAAALAGPLSAPVPPGLGPGERTIRLERP